MKGARRFFYRSFILRTGLNNTIMIAPERDPFLLDPRREGLRPLPSEVGVLQAKISGYVRLHRPCISDQDLRAYRVPPRNRIPEAFQSWSRMNNSARHRGGPVCLCSSSWPFYPRIRGSPSRNCTDMSPFSPVSSRGRCRRIIHESTHRDEKGIRYNIRMNP